MMKEADIRPAGLFNRYLELARKDTEALLKGRDRFVETACPACGDGRSAPAFEKLGFRYVLCGGCGSLYASPRPSAEQLDAFYRDSESVRFWSQEFYRGTEEARREKMFKPRARLVAELAERHKVPPGAFADVGSGTGIFLEEIRGLGRFDEVLGIEPGPGLAEASRRRGFRVVGKAAEELVPADCQAGFATAFEVLEHVYDPLRFVSGVRKALKPGGLVMMTTLTVSGFDIQVLWRESKSVHPPHHINLMSLEGLKRLVERSGLRLVELSTPGQLDIDIVANAAKENPSLALPRFVKRLLESGDKARSEFQGFLSRNGLSSHARIVAAAP